MLKIAYKNHVFIIAEAGVNHNGSIDMAKELIDVASDAGADAIKFQTFKAEEVISKYAPKAEYQKKTTAQDESQLDMIKKLQLDEETHYELVEHCKNRGIMFLSTPFDFMSIEFLANKLNLPILKIPSGEITNGPYLLKVAQTGKPIIMSTGMATLAEIETALGVLAFGYLKRRKKPSLEAFHHAFCLKEGQKILKEKVTLLHCTTEYPAPFEEANLKAMHTLEVAFGLPVGLSDHTEGIAIPIAATAMEARVIEKHFTLDRNLPGPDHKASIEPQELKEMVKCIRHVELALGDGRKLPLPSEVKNIPIARKSLVAKKEIKKGEIFTEENLTVKRPGIGISPIRYWEFVGKTSSKSFSQDNPIE